jgi:DNA-binding NtrC family response regulator
MTAILVVEDDPDVGELMADILEADLAASVKLAPTWRRAVEAIEADALDLAIIDIGLPEVSGFELATRATNMNIPTLLCSGDPDALVKLKKHDFPYLGKPFNIDQLVHEAANVIANTKENIRRVKDSLAKLQETTEGLRAGLKGSDRLVNQSKSLLSRGARPVTIAPSRLGSTSFTPPASD